MLPKVHPGPKTLPKRRTVWPKVGNRSLPKPPQKYRASSKTIRVRCKPALHSGLHRITSAIFFLSSKTFRNRQIFLHLTQRLRQPEPGNTAEGLRWSPTKSETWHVEPR